MYCVMGSYCHKFSWTFYKVQSSDLPVWIVPAVNAHQFIIDHLLEIIQGGCCVAESTGCIKKVYAWKIFAKRGRKMGENFQLSKEVYPFRRLPFRYYSHRVKSHKIVWFTLNLFAGITALYTHYITPAFVSYLRSLVVKALHRHRKGVGSIPAGERIVDDVFLNCSWLKFRHVYDFHSNKDHLPFRYTSSIEII